MALKAFFSYCHVDERYRKKIDTHLAGLKHQGLISSWSDHEILPGSTLDSAIDRQLEAAEIILLLISPEFIASNYCYNTELKRAIERHKAGTAQVIPIIARPCDWHSLPFGTLKALPEDGKAITTWTPQDLAYTDIAKKLRVVVEELKARSDGNSPPKVEPSVSPVLDDAEIVKLVATLSVNSDDATLQRIGCPCLILRLTCLSKRPAKIAVAKLHVRGPHVLPAMQAAFGTDFGYGAGKAQPIEEPSLTIDFLPMAKPNTSHGFIIDQDDRCDFFIPSQRDLLLYFMEAPPDDVFVTVKYLNGTSEKLLQGLEVQTSLPNMVRLCLDKAYTLNTGLHPAVGMDIKSTEIPDSPPNSFLNDETLHFPPHPRRDVVIDAASDLIRFRAKILRAGGAMDATCEDWLIGVVRSHTDIDVRRDAIVALRRLSTPKVRELFFDLLATEFNEHTRELIVRSFSVVGTVEDLPTLERMIKGEASRFCREAAHIATLFLRDRFPNRDGSSPLVYSQQVESPPVSAEGEKSNAGGAPATTDHDAKFLIYLADIIEGIKWTWSWKDQCAIPHVGDIEILESWCAKCGKRIDPKARTTFTRETYGGRQRFGSGSKFGERHYSKPHASCDFWCDDNCTRLSFPQSVADFYNRIRRHIEKIARDIVAT